MATASDPRANELGAIVREIRDRVRARYPEGQPDGLPAPLADLTPLLHARDAAEAKVAAIGSVNPRPAGFVNNIIQSTKRNIARALGWFIRDQVEFNRSTVNAIDAALEALNEVNRSLVAVSGRIDKLKQDGVGLRAEATELKDIRVHWIRWRESWEKRLHHNEAQFLRSVAELNGAFEHRVSASDVSFRDSLRVQHSEYLVALEKANKDIQARLWSDLDRIRLEYERMIHYELRLIRQRSQGLVEAPPPAVVQDFTEFDYTRFADKFRGSEDYVRQTQSFYVPYFKDCHAVLDIGCGRGEFLEVMREAGIQTHGIDLDSSSVEECRNKGLSAEVADLFHYLSTETGEPFDGIFAAQLAEHLPPTLLPRMIKLCAARLKPGGVLALETPNPESLAIFATHFYIDPTHTRPIPPALMAFYFEEFGLGRIEVQRRFPAGDSMPEVKELPQAVQEKFFGSLDYAIIGRKL
ncbi:MAG TPA: class I SAM-dependent methyltransferase [Bryobacteraceae bacterium]|nr:class I SAM-dependent methyltransferase [Bryobacteraceae bacterium]